MDGALSPSVQTRHEEAVTVRSASRFLVVPLLLGFAAGASRAATPSTVTIHATDTQQTFQTALLAGANPTTDRSTCVFGVSCDTLHLVIAPGDYTGKRLRIAIDWLVPANDFDLYTFEDVVDGTSDGISNDGVPGTHEEVPLALGGVVSAPRVIAIEVVSSTTSPEMVNGTISLVAPPPARTATITTPDHFYFSPSVTVLAPGAGRDCEPSLRVDTRGNCYVGGIRGVPAGVDMWRFDLDPTSPTFDPQLRNPLYLGQPDAFSANDTTGGKDGGGDIDIATSFPTGPSAVPVVTVVSLAAANISSATSTDRGVTFVHHPDGNVIPSDDRQWIEAQGADTVYDFYRAPVPATGLFVDRSTDHGATWPTTSLVSPTGSTPGYIDIDHTTGMIYVSHVSSSALFVSRSPDRGATWTTVTVDNSTSHHNLFDVVKVGEDGAVYATWSDRRAIYLAHSLDHGVTWSAPVQVSGPESQSALFPWLEAGSAGRVVVVWYGSATPGNIDACDWQVYAAFTSDATAQNPHVQIAQVSDHIVHSSNISLGGLGVDTPVTPQANRNLCDYFQVAIDPQGACVVAFSDDHNDFDGNTYVARQLAGPSLYASANGGSGELVPVATTPLPAPDPDQPEVTDFLHDATGSSLQPIPTDNPFDILSIDYACQQSPVPQLEVRMKVSALAPVPSNATWRVNFTANAPNRIGDRGDQFFLQARTDTLPTGSFVFGTATRDSNGSFTYAARGAADFGTFDTANNEVVMRLALTKLDPFVTHGPPVRAGSYLVGLRGATGTFGASAGRDVTRGGGEFRICPEMLSVEPTVETTFAMSAPMPNPSRGGATVSLSLSHAAWVEVAVFDAQGRRVRTVHAGTLAAGITRVAWDGRTDAGHAAPSGAYYVRMIAGGKAAGQRLIVVR
jgi:hypothetical protein